MARSGQDELELFLDEAPAVRAAKEIQKSQESVARTMGQTAKTFDQSYATAFKNIQQGSEETARKIKQNAEEASNRIKQSAQGPGFGAVFAGGVAAIASSQALQQVLQFAEEAGRAYVEGNRAAIFLESTQKRYNLSLVESQAQVAKLRQEYHLSQTEAERQLGAATQAAARVGSPEKGLALLTSAINLAESGTVDKERVQGLIRQIASGSAEAFEELVGKDATQVYEEFAKSIGRTASSLTVMEKAQLLANETIEQGTLRIGDHERAAAAAAGTWEKWAAAIDDWKRRAGEAGVGFIERLPLSGGVFNGFEGPRGGPLSAETQADLASTAAIRSQIDASEAERTRQRNLGIQALRDLQAMREYAEGARATRDEGPYADIRRATKAEVDRLIKANTDKDTGLLSAAGAGQIAIAQGFGQYDEAKRALEINKQLDAQLAEMKAKYSGDQNPLTQLAISGKHEMDALIETLKKLGPEFEAQSATIIKEAEKVQNLNFAKGLVSSVIDISNIQARIDSLTPDLVSAAAVGAYGQITDQFTVRESYKKETDVEKAKRLIAALDQEKASYGGDSDYERAARQAVLAQTAGLSAEALGADPTTRDRILKELKTEKDARVEDVKEAKKLREAQLASMKKQDEAAEKATAFYDGLAKSNLTGEEIGRALKKIANLSVGVDLNVNSDRAFQAAVADGTALDRLTTG